MIRKWLHNRKYKEHPKCPCGWRMIPTTRQHFENYWKCKFNELQSNTRKRRLVYY